jgi:DNA-binding winged helix-turn-helix (wHTH) protein/TolB-like protein
MARFLFGPYEFDADALELRRNGAGVRLQAQPGQVLKALVENADRVVSREELRQAVWGDSTFVDFESGLNFCISQLRTVLRDDASAPLYIRTFPRRGYQFVAPVRAVDGVGPETVFIPEPGDWERSRRLARIAIPVAAGILAAVAGVGIFLHIRSVHAAPPIVAIARFDNETGNPAFDSFANDVTDEVVARLAGGGEQRFSIIGNAKILFAPREQRDLRSIASDLHASYIVLGQVQSSGNQVRVLAHLIRASDQTHIWVIRIEGPVAAMAQREDPTAEQIAETLWGKLAAHPESAPSFQPGSH